MNPAVSFGAVLLGAALSGVAEAFLAVPVVAMPLSLLDICGKRSDLAIELPGSEKPADEMAEEPVNGGSSSAGARAEA